MKAIALGEIWKQLQNSDDTFCRIIGLHRECINTPICDLILMTNTVAIVLVILFLVSLFIKIDKVKILLMSITLGVILHIFVFSSLSFEYRDYCYYYY
jgi:hypothetical protein